MSFCWIMYVPFSIRNNDRHVAFVYVATRTVSLILLVSGMLWDQVLQYPDSWDSTYYKNSMCINFKRCNCICTSHSIWHIFALAATLVTLYGTESIIVHTAAEGHNY
jgi:hypothetical protein